MSQRHFCSFDLSMSISMRADLLLESKVALTDALLWPAQCSVSSRTARIRFSLELFVANVSRETFEMADRTDRGPDGRTRPTGSARPTVLTESTEPIGPIGQTGTKGR